MEGPHRWTVVIRNIPVIAEKDEYLDYGRECIEEHQHLTLKEVMGYVNHFAEKYPDAEFYGGKLEGNGMIYNEGPGGIYHDLEIIDEGS